MAGNLSSLPDTNVILRYLLKDDVVRFGEAELFFEGVRSGKEKVIILESVLVECVYVLMKFYKVPRGKAVEALTGLLQYKGVVNRDRVVLLSALSLFGANNLDVVDCVLLARARDTGQRIKTFDNSLKKLAAKRAEA
jgi:predicted nucleic-acid-binding protein